MGAGDRDVAAALAAADARAASARAASASELTDILRRIDNRPYGAYHDIEGAFDFGGGGMAPFRLTIDQVQSDPFASPSRCHVSMPMAATGIFPEAYSTKTRCIALCDFLTRAFTANAKAMGADERVESGGWGGAKGGELRMDRCTQHVVERTSVVIRGDTLEGRFTVALPARGRTIQGAWAAEVLTQKLPELVRSSFLLASLDAAALKRHVLSVEDQEHLRGQLSELGLVAFVRDGAVLPRQSGADDHPMPAGEAVPFKSPDSLAVTVRVPNAGEIRGMGVRTGVSLIVGGGFHGKSTLLKALEVGVYNKVPGDGREFVVTDASAAKIRAEDGRCVTGVDISGFINNLPMGRDTTSFSTGDASGSTSQAANIVEALEAGCSTLLVDEDTAATNFMIRDKRMAMLVARDKEPITPFIYRVRELYEKRGVSSVLVVGGAGDYFETADVVVMMDNYKAIDATERAREIVETTGGATGTGAAGGAGAGAAAGAGEASPAGSFALSFDRVPLPASFTASGKVAARSKELVSYGDMQLELGQVEQLVEMSQTRAIADALQTMARRHMDGKRTVAEVLAALEADLDAHGLDALRPGHYTGWYSRPRRLEIAAAINRLRCGKIARKAGGGAGKASTPAATADGW